MDEKNIAFTYRSLAALESSRRGRLATLPVPAHLPAPSCFESFERTREAPVIPCGGKGDSNESPYILWKMTRFSTNFNPKSLCSLEGKRPASTWLPAKLKIG